MNHIKFIKMVAAGNDFIVIDAMRPALPAGRQAPCAMPLNSLAKRMCDRKYGIGADGLLALEKSKKGDLKMRIFNADGSEAQMCGNGARCAAFWINQRQKTPPSSRLRRAGSDRRPRDLKIETKAGVIKSQIRNNNVRIRLTEPKDIKLNIPIKVNNRTLKVNFINTGVPHAVIFVQGLEKIDVDNLGRVIRYHKRFRPAGTNVDFIECINDDFIGIRTYERGVEAETLACGTGCAAAALISEVKTYKPENKRQMTDVGVIGAKTKSGEILKVYFTKINNNFKNVWLEGKAEIVFSGQFTY
jgi:diaminopimelate epimerase